MNVTTIGLDLAKSVFQVHGIDAGRVVKVVENSAARVRRHGGRDQAAKSRSVGERSRVCQPSTRRMVI